MIRRGFYKHDVTCAAEGCGVVIGRGKIYCKGHYLSLPDALRARLWATWRAAMNARRGHTPMDRQAQANRAYHEAFLACQEQLRTVRPTTADAMSTVAIAAGDEAVRYVGGRML